MENISFECSQKECGFKGCQPEMQKHGEEIGHFWGVVEGQANIIELPEISKWKCLLFGTREFEVGGIKHISGFVWYASKGEVPNWFWRWMQYLCFGNKWVKEK